ncbi:cyclin-dependent kinase-like 2 isoform X4 [Lineus longissimus]|uniref:cyclin-dependent kinase-like 2 isoform X4 n=1 Tax=Lineus longissimus TaxID=88925 RepID=UPI00315DCDA2
MEKYENLGLVGEGSYGMVLKCRHKETGQIVAIKKFLESEDDKMVKKIAMREIRMLKQLRHENLVNLIEVFRRKKRLYLVFEFVDHTVLDDLERCPNGLDEQMVRRVLFQVLKGIEFCHLHNIIHRDIKPENILVSKSGIVKLCDFGFARTLAQPGETYTDYVATRWYRAPELLVGDTKYGRAVDIWAIGCLVAEMMTGEPLFPGDSDIDQLFHVVRCFGNLSPRHREIFHKNPLFVGMRLPEVREVEPMEKKFPRLSSLSIDFMKQCLRLDANDRPTCSQLVKHEFFQKDGFAQRFMSEIKLKQQREQGNNVLRQNSNKDKSDENKEKENGAKKKKFVKKQDVAKETRDSGEEKEKPRRKLPEPEKFIKKQPAPAPVKKHPSESDTQAAGHEAAQAEPTTCTTELDLNNSGGHQPMMPPINQGAQPNSPQRGSPTFGASINSISLVSPVIGSVSPQHGGPPPLSREFTSSAWVNDKVKKAPAAMYYKKQPAANHHSSTCTISPQPLQTERTILHEKTLQYDKMVNSTNHFAVKKPQKRASDEKMEKKDTGAISLPEIQGKLATLALQDMQGNEHANKPATKGKKNYLAQIPHITNIDPFSNNQSNTSNPASPE